MDDREIIISVFIVKGMKKMTCQYLMQHHLACGSSDLSHALSAKKIENPRQNSMAALTITSKS